MIPKEDCREFILRFDESDEEELAMSKRISDVLDRTKQKGGK
jgi:hypothetical protein